MNKHNGGMCGMAGQIAGGEKCESRGGKKNWSQQGASYFALLVAYIGRVHCCFSITNSPAEFTYMRRFPPLTGEIFLHP